MKPTPTVAMQHLIKEIRMQLPFNLPKDQICSDTCRGCSKKLLDHLDAEICEWEARISEGEIVGLRDLNKLARLAIIVKNALVKNGLIEAN